jgi:hypothetical protein
LVVGDQTSALPATTVPAIGGGRLVADLESENLETDIYAEGVPTTLRFTAAQRRIHRSEA